MDWNKFTAAYITAAVLFIAMIVGWILVIIKTEAQDAPPVIMVVKTNSQKAFNRMRVDYSDIANIINDIEEASKRTKHRRSRKHRHRIQ